ncbi:neural cell adhesion molecule 1-B-like [Carassius carassius]|uniref:neural cell adhesion molecule 1-B-like n=1 Tax=Carassius carassius TaxID=217509 RepID=UPI002868F345|nr:neural cell adhesion molecule 1-B-like [Carassius carassius]
MGSSALPLMILLMSFIHAGLTQVKAVLKVTPDEHVFRGETVTLTCDIQGAGDTQWIYRWFKDGKPLNLFTTTAAEYSFTGEVYHSAEYSCRGERSDSERSSDISAAVTLTVSDKPKPTLTVKPQSSVFTGDTVTLSCDVGQLTGWTIHWRKDSDPESTTDATKTIKSVRDSDEGEYRCRARRGNYYSEFSNTVTITVTVRPKPVVGVDPERRVFRGETVTLTCDIQQTGVWQYSWYKGYKQDYIIGRDQNYKIPSVDLSHRGFPRSSLTVTPDSPVFTGETVNLKCVIESHNSEEERECRDVSTDQIGDLISKPIDVPLPPQPPEFHEDRLQFENGEVAQGMGSIEEHLADLEHRISGLVTIETMKAELQACEDKMSYGLQRELDHVK